MKTPEMINFFHSPQSRSTATLTLLEELKAPYKLNVLDLKKGEQRDSAYLAINPLGKVPAIQHGSSVVTEQVAIFIYLADLYPAARLAPPVDNAGRGPYLRWLVYYAACYEPALSDRMMKHGPLPHMSSPYGTFEEMLSTVSAPLTQSPYLLGDKISAADILWGTAFHWGMLFKLVPEDGILLEYVKRITSRPSFATAARIDAELTEKN